MRYVTKTGRAIRHGTTTRASLRVKRPGVKPLPLHLQCHPQALHRTPVHPDCATFQLQSGMSIAAITTRKNLLRGKWLSKNSGLPVRVEIDGHGTYYHSNVVFAFAWKRAGELHGLTVKVYQQ